MLPLLLPLLKLTNHDLTYDFLSIWWAHLDSNQGPSDSGLCEFPHSLDFAFTIAYALGGCRQVSTPSLAGLARRCHMLPLRVRRI